MIVLFESSISVHDFAASAKISKKKREGKKRDIQLGVRCGK
jgi:hypothetical protein